MIVNKKWVALVTVILVIIIISLIVGLSGNNKEENKEIVKLNDIEFTNITKEYENGITTVRAEAKNNTEETRSVNVKVILKDKEGNILIETEQLLENIEPGEKKLLATGIMGDYSNAATIELSEIN